MYKIQNKLKLINILDNPSRLTKCTSHRVSAFRLTNKYVLDLFSPPSDTPPPPSLGTKLCNTVGYGSLFFVIKFCPCVFPRNQRIVNKRIANRFKSIPDTDVCRWSSLETNLSHTVLNVTAW